MLARILVPLDGSSRAECAVPIAARLARASNGTLILARAYQRPVFFGPAYVRPPIDLARLETYRQSLVAYLEGVSNHPALASLTVETAVLEGDPASAIVHALSELNIDAVVLTSHGRGGLLRWALGSVAQHLVRHAGVPVLVLRQHTSTLLDSSQDTHRGIRVLVPLDGSAAAEEIIPHTVHIATALASPALAALHLIIVASPYEFDRSNMPDALVVDGARLYLARLAAKLRDDVSNCAVTWSVIANLDIAEALTRMAETGDTGAEGEKRSGFDLIALSSVARGTLSRVLMGSVSERVLWTTTRPTLVVPVSATPAAGGALHTTHVSAPI